MPPAHDLLHLLRDIRRRGGESRSLADLAAIAGWSPFHLHRAFRVVMGETPKQYTLRLRLERAAAALVTTDASILDVAVETGFNSHEVFARAFRRHFGRTPRAYRAGALSGAATPIRERHATLVNAAGPCIGLYHRSPDHFPRRSPMPTLSIERRELAAQPFLFVHLKAGRGEVPKAMAEGFGKTFPYVMQAGLPIAGRPTTRYRSVGPGLFDMEIGIPVAVAATGQGDIEAGSLPGGPAAVAVHGGSYDTLHETYAAMEGWIEANGYRTGGAPWESYVTDPAECPDPNDWRTEIYWPLEKS